MRPDKNLRGLLQVLKPRIQALSRVMKDRDRRARLQVIRQQKRIAELRKKAMLSANEATTEDKPGELKNKWGKKLTYHL